MRMAAKTQAVSAVQSSVKRVRVTIRGLAPGLIFQGKGVMEADADDAKKKKKRSPEEEAMMRAHWMGKGDKRELCIPWVMLYQSICKAAGSFKFRGAKTYTSMVAATVSCEVDNITLGSAEYEVFEEYVRIPPRTGVMVKIGRPRIREWKASFIMVVDDEMYAVDNLHAIIVHAGKLIGIGAWRPELKGPYGRFTVEEFEVI
jgi:hypothetical protein